MEHQDERGAFEFTGSWREYAPIAFSNLLLTVVTLGLYSFWGRTRTRRYLWSHTRFIDDQLEWTGTGRELFLGTLLVMLLVFVPLAAINLLAGGLVLQGSTAGRIIGVLLFPLSYGFLFALGGLAIFRALRYRLSRTYWHGIRGGSDAQGFRYALSYVGHSLVGSFVFGLLVPWAMISMWNERWNAMSFGPYPFRSGALTNGLMRRYLPFYLVPLMTVILALLLASAVGMKAADGQPNPLFVIGGGIVLYLLFAGLMGLVGLSYYAAYFRQGINNLTLGHLEFEFTARTKDWLKLTLGNAALVVCTLGIGAAFVSYRNWAFFVRHLRAYGTLDADQFTQSTTPSPRRGEGLFESLDMGAF